MIKVCHITSVHKAEDVRIFEKECISLAKNGFDVSFVVPNAKDVTKEDVKIIGISVNAEQSRIKRMLKTSRDVVNKAIALKADVYHFHDPELLLFAKKLKKTGAKVIYDAHEDLPRQIKDKPYIPSYLRVIISWLVERFENKMASNVLSGVVGATPHIYERFSKVSTSAENINNYPKLESFPTVGEWSKRNNNLCYIGGVFKTRGAFEMVTILPKINSKLEIAGSYSPPSLRNELVEAEGWDCVIEHGFVSTKEVSEILKSCKVGLVLLHPTESYVKSLPIKMFEYMASGIPVIASNFPIWKEIIDKHQCGICVNPFDKDAIIEAVENINSDDNLAQKMGENGRKAVETYYTWEGQAKKLIRFYNSLLNH